MCDALKINGDLMILKGSKLEGYEKHPFGVEKIYSIKKDQVYKLELRSVINNSVASK